MNQSEFGDTPVSRCQYYRQVCGLPAIVDPPQLGRIVVRAEIVWALMMPAHLGQLVKGDLQRRGHGIGPIMSHPRSRRWSYLVRPDLPNDDSLFAEMFRLDVSVVRAGGEIALPSPADKCARFRQWIEPPRGAYRASGQLIVASIRHLTRDTSAPHLRRPRPQSSTGDTEEDGRKGLTA
ncbi:DNA-directed RNA polymerase subunit beta [Nocardia asiatica]|uniref:DNA-directed RNA polymerase subunit beta n=1 Tax=Nocardia asiatica TaxID=209252 RepID=UPI003EE38D02